MLSIFLAVSHFELRSCNWTSSRAWNCVYFFHWWEIVFCGSPKNSQNELAAKQLDVSASRLQRMHSTFCKSVRSVLRCRNTVMLTSLSLNLALKSPGSITKKCCWCRNCCQWSATLLQVYCLSSSKTMHQDIGLMICSCHEVHETPHSLICGQPTLLN